jgi:hypothetical protein
MLQKKIKMVGILLLTVSLLAACGSGKDREMDTMDHSSPSEESKEGMHHSSSGELPEGLQEAENPTYKAGSKAIITADHMGGMDGAEATIAGAYKTTAYAISFTRTDTGEEIKGHKWIIHEEIEDAGDVPYEAGDEVTVSTDHMEGMDGADAVIDSAVNTIVYMVDYTSTTDGQEVKNHKWVTESELSAK